MSSAASTTTVSDGRPVDPQGELFVSYSRADSEAVHRLCASLQRENVRLFVDRNDLTAGIPWWEEIEQALKRATAVAVVVGPTGLGPIQKREMGLALERQAQLERLGERLPVVPVLLGSASVDDLPGFLRLNTAVDFRAGIDDPPALERLIAVVQAPATAPEAKDNLLCPYRGLLHFREEDAPFYFGAERSTALLRERVASRKVVVVVGPSGAGKSSLVQAGLLPALRLSRPPQTVWDVVTAVPGQRPWANLVQGVLSLLSPQRGAAEQLTEVAQITELLRKGSLSLPQLVERLIPRTAQGRRLLLFVDQLEELFTLAPADERAPFVTGLLEAANELPVVLVFTLRADFYGQAMSVSPLLSEALQDGSVNVGSLGREGIRRAVERPAARLGVTFEKGLVERILDHVESQPGSLPLLEFALTELWRRRRGTMLTNEAYDALGSSGSRNPAAPSGVLGAIAKRAEMVFAGLGPARQPSVLRAFTRLVRVASAQEEGTDSRRRITVASLSDDEKLVMETFASERLVVRGRDELTGEATLEVAHEALIRHWPRLTELLAKQREFLLWRQQLGLFLGLWEAQQRDPALLLRGKPLTEALAKMRAQPGHLNEAERAYLGRSREARRWPRKLMVAVVAAGLAVAGTVWGVTRTDWYQVRAAVSDGLSESPKADPQAVTVFATALSADGKQKTALELMTGIHDKEKRLEELVRMAELLIELGRQEDARASLDLARTLPGEKVSLTAELAGAMARIGLVDEALMLPRPGNSDWEKGFVSDWEKGSVVEKIAIGAAYLPATCADQRRVSEIAASLPDPIQHANVLLDAARALHEAHCDDGARRLLDEGLSKAAGLHPGAKRYALEKAAGYLTELGDKEKAAKVQSEADAAEEKPSDKAEFRAEMASARPRNPAAMVSVASKLAKDAKDNNQRAQVRTLLEQAEASVGAGALDQFASRELVLAWARLGDAGRVMAALTGNANLENTEDGDAVAALASRIGASAAAKATLTLEPARRERILEATAAVLVGQNDLEAAETIASQTASTDAWLQIAAARIGAKQTERARAALGQARLRLESSAQIPALKAQASWALAQRYAEIGDGKEALHQVETIQDGGARLVACLRLVHLLLGKGQKAQAMTVLARGEEMMSSLHASPEIASTAYVRLSLLYSRLGLFRKARSAALRGDTATDRLIALSSLVAHASPKTDILARQLDELADERAAEVRDGKPAHD